MNVLVASIYYAEIQQCYPLYIERMKKLDPKPKKAILYDIFEQKKLDSKLVEGLIEIRQEPREKELMKQVSRIRNEVIKEAKKDGFEAVLFIQPNIFPPADILQKLFDSNKDVIAPAFFSFQNMKVYSNAMKNIGVTGDGKEKVEMVFFNELLPGGVKEVFGVSLESIFLRKSVFDALEFKVVSNALDEMLAFKEQVEKQKKGIFVDSSTVCSKLNPIQLMSYYYFKAQELEEKIQGK